MTGARSEGQRFGGAEPDHSARAAIPTQGATLAQDLLLDALHDLAETQARYLLIASNASDVVSQATADGTIEWISPSVTDVLGWAPDDLIGKRAIDLLHPDDGAEILRHQPSIEAGTARNFEARIRTADGTYRWMVSHVQPVLGADGKVIARVAGWRDNQVQHESVEALRHSEAQFRLLADHATDVVYAADPDRRVTWVSPAVSRVLGWEVEDLIGTEMAELLHPDDRRATEADRLLVYSGTPVPHGSDGFLVRMRTKAGDYHWMRNRITIVSDDAGTPVGIVGGLTLVDDLVEARRRAEADEELLRAIAAAALDPHVVLVPVRGDDGRVCDFRHRSANPAACQYLGRTESELLAQTILEVMPGLAESGLMAAYVSTLESATALALDDVELHNALLSAVRYYDIRARRVGTSDILSLTWRDVTDRHEVERRLRESEQRYRLIAENSSDVVLLARNGIMQWLSPAITQTLGWTPEEWEGRAFEEFTHPDDVALARSRRAEITAGGHRKTSLRQRGKDGTYHWIEIHAGPFVGDDGVADGILASFRVVDQEVATEQELQRMARFDDLTGALKREGAMARLAALMQSQRSPGDQSSVLFIDIDDFKAVNDTYGHASGDAWLRALSTRISAVVRAEDAVARLGGDEFLVIIEGIHGTEDAEIVAEKIRLAALEPVITDAGAVQATVSIGVTLCAPDETVDEILSRADHAMYAAKHKGRNQVVLL